MPTLLVHRRAARYLERMDARTKAQLVTKLQRLASNLGEMSGVKPMAGEWAGFYRIRHGDLRVIYFLDRPADTIVIAHIGPRGDIYK
jgi:mRNA interferase RelE/StbE